MSTKHQQEGQRGALERLGLFSEIGYLKASLAPIEKRGMSLKAQVLLHCCISK
jgi:hypothetical protein